MNRTTYLLSSAFAAVAVLSAPAAFAQARTLSIDAPEVKLTMAQAVVIAEWMGQGRATRVRLDDRAAQPVYRVTVKSPGEAPLKLHIAATDGRIVASERRDGKD